LHALLRSAAGSGGLAGRRSRNSRWCRGTKQQYGGNAQVPAALPLTGQKQKADASTHIAEVISFTAIPA